MPVRTGRCSVTGSPSEQQEVLAIMDRRHRHIAVFCLSLQCVYADTIAGGAYADLESNVNVSIYPPQAALSVSGSGKTKTSHSFAENPDLSSFNCGMRFFSTLSYASPPAVTEGQIFSPDSDHFVLPGIYRCDPLEPGTLPTSVIIEKSGSVSNAVGSFTASVCCDEQGCSTLLQTITASARVTATWLFNGPATTTITASVYYSGNHYICGGLRAVSDPVVAFNNISASLIECNGERLVSGVGFDAKTGAVKYVGMEPSKSNTELEGSGTAQLNVQVESGGEVEYVSASITINLESDADVNGDGVFDSNDLRQLLQVIISNNQSTLADHIAASLDLDASGNELFYDVSLDDFLILLELVGNFSSVVIGDTNDDGARDWCDVSILSNLISTNPVLISESQYDPLLDMDFDGLISSSDLFLIRQGLTRRQGDATADGDVDFADITAVLSNWNTQPGPWGPGDANGDGVVNFSDITAVNSNMGFACQ